MGSHRHYLRYDINTSRIKSTLVRLKPFFAPFQPPERKQFFLRPSQTAPIQGNLVVLPAAKKSRRRSEAELERHFHARTGRRTSTQVFPPEVSQCLLARSIAFLPVNVEDVPTLQHRDRGWKRENREEN